MANTAEVINQAIADFDTIKEAIEESGVEVPYDTDTSEYGNKIRLIAEGREKAFDAGKQAEYDRFWDKFQDYGNREIYTNAFAYGGWNDDIYNPKYTIRPTSCNAIFLGSTGITDTKIDIDLTNPNGNQKFQLFMGSAIKTVKKLIVNETNNYSQCFETARRLKNITFEGVIGRTINFSYSPLTVESMKNVIEHLANYVGTDKELSYTLTFTEACWANLEADSTAPNGGTWRDYILSLGWNA